MFVVSSIGRQWETVVVMPCHGVGRLGIRAQKKLAFACELLSKRLLTKTESLDDGAIALNVAVVEIVK